MNLPAIFRLKRCDKPKNGVFAYTDMDPTFLKCENGRMVEVHAKGSVYTEETYKDGELWVGQGWFSPTEKMSL